MKVSNPVDQVMLARIKKRGQGWVFSASDFLDLGSRPAVDKALSRMAAAKTVRRVVRGLYDIPQHHPILGILSPDADNVAKALASRSGTRLQPTGACAANLLGFSDQVPMRMVFLTDGRSKRVLLGKLEISFKRTSPRLMAAAGTISGLVIHALRYLGKAHVRELKLQSLASRLSPADRKRLLADAALAPAWIGDIMRRLAAKNFKLLNAVDDLDPDENTGQYL
jgi:hypothetical protein